MIGRLAFDIAGWLRSHAEGCVHLIVHSRSGDEGFAIFGGHRPRHYFSRLYLGAREHRVRFGFHGAAATASCRRLLHEYGLVIFCGDTTPPGLASEVLQIPGMVDLVMPTPAVLQGPLARWSSEAKEGIRRVRRSRFQCVVQTGEEWVSDFHRLFHIPSIRHRHGREAYTASARELRDAARAPGAEFLRIDRDGAWVGGSLNRSMPDGYHLQRVGWRGGDAQLLRDGVVSAVYWFSLRRASELRHGSVHFGSVSPDLDDGLLFFKGKWGARLQPLSQKYGQFQLLVDPSHDTCRRFLAAHSLLARGSNGDAIVFSARRPEDMNVPRTILSGVSRWYRWREQRDVSGSTTQAEVPPPLRSWLVEEPLPETSARAPRRPTEIVPAGRVSAATS